MALESSSGGIWVLNDTWPEASDDLNQGDDHLRTIKASIKNTFPNISATASLSAGALNFINSINANVQTQLDTLSKSLAAAISTQSALSESLSAEIARSNSLSASLAANISRTDALSDSITNLISKTDTISSSLQAEISRTDALSDAINLAQAYGFMSINDGSTAYSATTSLTTFIGWETVGFNNDIDPSTVSGAMNINSTGLYSVFYAMSFSGAANVTFDFKLFKGTTDTGFGMRRKIGSGGDVGSGAFMGEVSANPSDKLYIRVKSDAADTGYTPQFSQFMVRNIK